MKRFIASGIILSWVFLATSSGAATAGAGVKGACSPISCNVVGFVNSATNSHVFAGCCYEAIGGGSMSLEELFGKQFTPGPNGDKVAIWDATKQNYAEYMKAQDGRFYSTRRGMFDPVDVRVPAGTALWIIRKNPDSVIVMAGEYSNRAVITNSLVGATNYPANMICYPYPVDMSVQNFINTSHGAQASDDPKKADKLSLWTEKGMHDVQLGLKADGKWHELRGWATNAPSTRIIKACEGVCFQASQPITWIVPRPSGL